jgi:mitofilin
MLMPPKGPIEGTDAEAIFSRAHFALQAGDLNTAVTELNELRGLPRQVVSDWIDAAKTRLAVEQTVCVIKAHVTLLAVSLA